MESTVWLNLAKFIQILYIKDINTDNNHTKEYTSPPPWKIRPPINHCLGQSPPKHEKH